MLELMSQRSVTCSESVAESWIRHLSRCKHYSSHQVDVVYLPSILFYYTQRLRIRLISGMLESGEGIVCSILHLGVDEFLQICKCVSTQYYSQVVQCAHPAAT